jgi:hypothetical protein
MTPTPTPARAAARTAAPVPHRAATTLLTLVVPLAVMVATVALALAWRDRLPDPVASHWGPDGVDGASSFAGLLSIVPLLGLPAAVLAWWFAFAAGRSALSRRTAAAVALWTSTFTCALTVVTLSAQLDVDHWSQARDLDGGLALTFAVPVVVALLGAWATPGDGPAPAASPVPDTAPRLPLPDGGQAAWLRRVDWVHPGVIVALVVGFSALMGAVTRSWWFPVTVGVFLLAVLLGLSGWTVTVDARGLVAKARLPRPRLVVPLDEVEHAEVVTVHPLREFGGWGLRVGLGGRVGVVVRSGEAIEVTRTGGRRVVVTVDDAATAAALLNTLAARARG